MPFRILHLALFTITITLASSSAFAAQKVGEPCGSRAQIACQKDLWCEPPEGLCSVAEQLGRCQTAPQICTREYRPVCGCNGKTYGNDCERRAARVGLNYKGKCLEPKTPNETPLQK